MSYANGLIPANKLTSLGDGQALEANAARSWKALIAKAAKEGFNFKLTDSYRPRAVQEAIFFDRYLPQKTGNGPYGDVKTYKGVRYVRRLGTASAATPGTSIHGKGNALDIAGIYSNYGAPRTKGYLWLAANAPAYGWTNPNWATTKNYWEPWHWEYTKANDTHPKDNDEVEIDLKSLRRTVKSKTTKDDSQTLGTGKWTTLRLNKLAHTSLTTAPGYFDAELQVALEGATPGREVQLRFVAVEKDAKTGKWVVAGKFPVTEAIGTGGGTFVSVRQKGHLGKGQRLRVLAQPFGSSVKATSVLATVDVYN